MRWGPHEDQSKHQDRFSRDRARGGDPANQGREGPCRAANYNILRRDALEPYGVNHRIEEDGKGQPSSRMPIGRKPQHENGEA